LNIGEDRPCEQMAFERCELREVKQAKSPCAQWGMCLA
jgi:hypothetical protein